MKEPKPEKKKGLPKPDIVSYALKLNVNSVTCVFVVHFKSSTTYESL